jgi:hypothetical protein
MSAYSSFVNVLGVLITLYNNTVTAISRDGMQAGTESRYGLVVIAGVSAIYFYPVTGLYLSIWTTAAYTVGLMSTYRSVFGADGI